MDGQYQPLKLEAGHSFYHMITLQIASKLLTSVAFTRQPNDELDNLFSSIFTTRFACY